MILDVTISKLKERFLQLHQATNYANCISFHVNSDFRFDMVNIGLPYTQMNQLRAHWLKYCWLLGSSSPTSTVVQDYRKVSNIRRTKSKNWNDSHLVLKSSLPNPLKPGVKSRMKDVVWAAPTADAPNTSEWSTLLLPIKVRLILETWW